MTCAMHGTGYGRNAKKGVIIIPPTTDSALVFPFDHEAKRYDKNFYSPALTEGRLSTEQVAQFLGQVEEAYKQKFDKLRLLRKYLTISMILGGCLFMILTSMAISDYDGEYTDNEYTDNEYSDIKQRGNLRSGKKHDSDYDQDTEDLFMVFLGWGLFLLGTLVWTIILAVYSRISLKRARKAVQSLIDRENQFFGNYGLRWNVPLAFPNWIELWKDYKGQNYNYIPNQANFSLPHSNQVQNHIQNPRQPQGPYPSFNRTIDPSGYLDLQHRTVPLAHFNNQANGQDTNNYTPPYPVMFSNNNNN